MRDSNAFPLPLPVLVVHMEKHGERRRRLASELEPWFSDVGWLSAVEGVKLGHAPPWTIGDCPSAWPWNGWLDPYARRAMTMGEVGCAASHVLAWHRVAGGGQPVLVLEDDASPVGPLMDTLPALMRDLRHLDFDLCYLSQRNDPGPKPLAGRHVHVVDYHPLWTLAYILSPKGARKLAASPWRNNLAPADEMLPAVFGLNSDGVVNDVYATGGTVLAANQRFFSPAAGWENSETEKSPPVRDRRVPLTALTVATEEKPELVRLVDSGLRYGFGIKPLGLGTRWNGGDMDSGPGGGQKVNLLRDELGRLEPDVPVLFVDGYDTIVTRHARDILRAWRSVSGGSPLFAAEVHCWPDAELADRYPPSGGSPYSYLNSGAFIGRAGDLLRIVEDGIGDGDDDQRYYTGKFLSGEHGIALDHNCQVFQCLNGSLDHVDVDEGRGMVYNGATDSWPSVVHANGPAKPWLDGHGRAVGGRVRSYYGDMEV